MIKLSNIYKTYSTGKANKICAINNLSLEIEKGELLAIMGASGSGKSTLINILAGILNFDSGSYKFNGMDIDKASEKELSAFRNKKIGYIHQEFQLLNENTVFENVEIPLLFSNYKKSQRKNMCNLALESVGIIDLKIKPVNNLSGGQKQRVAIARAIVNNPELILADEPTGSLDSKKSNEIMDLFKKINQNGTTIIIVTHDEKIAKQCNRIINITDGCLC